MEKKKYTPGKAPTEAREKLEQHREKKPGKYESQWQPQADSLLTEIKNRSPFSYDAGQDPLYRQAVDQYVRLGRKAMMDTQGRAAAMTGGYGNSYAMTAGQQTYGEYLQALAARLPQFQDMALRRYEANGKNLMDRYQALNQREKDAYGRYEKTVERYWDMDDRLQNAYDREADRDYNRYVNDRDYDYALDRDRKEAEAQAERDRLDQERWEKDREYQAQRDKTRDDQWERQFAENKRRYELEWAAKHTPAGGGGGGGSYRSRTNLDKYQGKHSLTEKEYDKKREEAQKNGHYNPRPSGSPWSPGHRPGRRPNHRLDLTY